MHLFLDTGAIFSEPERVYRYDLWRIWEKTKPYVLFVGLNPSTADEEIDDNTVTRCRRYAAGWGYGGMHMANFYAFRSTKPEGLLQVEDPVGPENDLWLEKLAKDAGIIIAAWGAWKGIDRERAKKVLEILGEEVYCLRVTKGGYPEHPLYLRKDLEPRRFDERY